VALKTQGIDQDALALRQRGRTCDRKRQHLCGETRFIEVLSVLKPLRVLAKLKESVGSDCAIALRLVLLVVRVRV
jgi:hypothetical protein